MHRFAFALRAFGPALGTFLVLCAVWSCGGNPSAPGTGTLTVLMAFDNDFTVAASRAMTTPLEDGDFGSEDRTPLADLIVSFNSVSAWSCADDDSSDEEFDDDAPRLLPSDGDDEEDDDEDDEEDCEQFVVLADSVVTLSASGLDTTLTGFLGSALLPVGDYDFLVLGIVDAWVVTEAGDTVEAKVPSGRIKVKSPFSISEGGSTDMVIVLDLNRSVVETPPGSMNFLVKPVLHSHVGWWDDDDHDEDDGEDD